jgi:hypothetical protein
MERLQSSNLHLVLLLLPSSLSLGIQHEPMQDQDPSHRHTLDSFVYTASILVDHQSILSSKLDIVRRSDMSCYVSRQLGAAVSVRLLMAVVLNHYQDT